MFLLRGISIWKLLFMLYCNIYECFKSIYSVDYQHYASWFDWWLDHNSSFPAH